MIRPIGKLVACTIVFLGFAVLVLLTRGVEALRMISSGTLVRMSATQGAAQMLARLLGITIQISTTSQKLAQQFRAGCLVVSNHQSYLDIVVLASYFPVLFVAKEEVRHWPILGFIARQVGTLFIERNNARQSAKCMSAIAVALQQNNSVLIFPEGTSTDGRSVLPFKPMLFNAACKAITPVLPLTLQYQAINNELVNEHSRALCCWFSEMEFVDHFWRVLALRKIDVLLEVHPMIHPSPQTTAQELAHYTYRKVTQAHAVAKQGTAIAINPVATASKFGRI